MDGMITKLRKIIDDLQRDIDQEIEEKRQEFSYHLEQKRVVFEQEVVARHRLLKMKLLKFLQASKIGAIVTAPVIYSLIIPFVLLDLFVTVYQLVCFPIYRIPYVRRDEYVVMDRKYLQYLNIIEKFNCIYCEYANGVIGYVREVASRTEWFWCPIKHSRKVKGAHERYFDFIEYGDAENFQKKLTEAREKCRACEAAGDCPSHKS